MDDLCAHAPRHTLRIKSGPGQWENIAKSCDGCLPDVLAVVKEEREDAGALQVIPYSKRDWPPVPAATT